jgi:hypothetical protein
MVVSVDFTGRVMTDSGATCWLRAAYPCHKGVIPSTSGHGVILDVERDALMQREALG